MAKEGGHNIRNEKPISLAPLTTEEALRAALSVKKEDVEASEQAEKDARAEKRDQD